MSTQRLLERPSQALATARARATRAQPSRMVGAPGLLMLQRKAGNAAVSALMAAKFRGPDETAVKQIDGALREFRRDEPAIETVEPGLKAAKATGVPVDLEGIKPPASALAVTTTGFGPGNVPAKKPVPPPKPVPKVSPLGKAGTKVGAKPTAGGKAAGPASTPTNAPPAFAPPATTPSALSGDQLLQPPVPPTHVRPEQDPAYGQVVGGVKGFAKHKRSHPPASAKAKEAQDAAVPPTGDVPGQAKAAKVDSMDAQRPGTFDKKTFIAAVKTAIEAKSPKTLKEADNYKASGKAGEVKGEVKGLVTAGKEGQTKDIETATEAPPDQSKAVPKTVTAMGPEAPGNTVVVPADGSVPKRAPPEQVNLAAGKAQADQELADAEVTEEQLATSNEPAFEQALSDKKTAAAHADTAPGEFRKTEGEVLDQNKAEAKATTASGVAGMQGAKGAALAKLVADKGKAKTKDESKRAEVTAKIDQIFTTTETAVKKILDGIDPLVEKEFNAGEARARAAFESFVAAKMSAYKKDRYGGWLGGLRWAKDKLFGMPAKVNEFYTAGRELYLAQMDGVISRVADIVGNNLTAAKQRIATGRTEISTYVKSLPKDLQKVGSDASKEINERFTQLESDVDEKQNSVVDTLATKYVEARKGLDERIEALQAENKGLVDKAIDGIKAVINTIRELVAMLKDVLARAAGVVGQIIKDPIGFLGNLVAGIKGGILKFADNILGHLRKGLMSWLFGALAEGGVKLPDSFDVKGIIKLLASIFGLTWANIRNRLVKQIGEKAMGAIEKGVEIFSVLATHGVSGLWQMLLEKLGDIKEMILEQVKDFVITKIITAGITWLIGLLNPAAAFIKACKLIYDVIMFFVNNASRIMKFVNTVIDSAADVARGNVGGVISKINDVLGQMVPILIGFLASVIGIGGIGEKIRSIIQKLQKPVNAALDFVIKKGLQLAAPIIRGLKGVGKKVKAKVAAGKAYVKGKVDAGKERLSGGDVRATARRRVVAALGKGATPESIRGQLSAIRSDLAPRGLKRLELGHAAADGTVQVMAEASPFDQLLKLIPRYLKKREDKETGELTEGTPHVTLKITLTLDSAEDVLPTSMKGRRPSGTEVARDDEGRPIKDEGGNWLFSDPVFQMPGAELTTSAKPKRGRGLSTTQQRSGGLIEPPKPGEKLIRMVTFNTAEGSSVQSNATHAERQFASWLRSETDAVWRRRVKKVEAEINYSPCTLCTRDLQGIADLTSGADKATRTLSWSIPYVDKKRKGADNRSTTNATLAAVAGSGWTVTPAGVTTPATPPAPAATTLDQTDKKELVPAS